ncbi:hypothetical protein DW355_14130 [Hylemonella gracilis]|uniref:Uncharacterized protein n=1 Tax=Hylemonella gracilis TaxID=80880 RepID=A0A4P6UN84_9BURK|nr:hypothetical protein [Hylemonella gracilis]QBK05710.1 hypothetical protein DW355_14130 [Hylemonella gracilis]
MFSSPKKFLTLSRSWRVEKKGRSLRAPGVDAQAEAQGGAVSLERVRLAMSGAMQASLVGSPATTMGSGTGKPQDDRALTGRMPSEPEGLDARANAQVDLLQRQLRSAPDLDTLWYLRPGLMNVIAVRQGEVAARDCLVALTALFKHHQPLGQSARPGAF